MHQRNTPGSEVGSFRVYNTGQAPLNWAATAPGSVTLTPSSGSVPPGGSQSVTVRINNPGSFGNGTHAIGLIQVSGDSANGSPAENSPATVSLSLFVGSVQQIYLPIVRR
jgi:hypothetical protein